MLYHVDLNQFKLDAYCCVFCDYDGALNKFLGRQPIQKCHIVF